MEKWKTIIGADRYQVSNLGGVRKKLKNNNFRVLSESLDKKGYNRIGIIYNDGVRRKMLVHRLVAQCFIRNTESKEFINHKNGIKNDNRVGNLEWCTKSENTLHAYRTGLKKRPNGEANHFSKLKEIDVRLIRDLKNNYGLSNKLLSEIWDIQSGCVSKIHLRQTWRHI